MLLQDANPTPSFGGFGFRFCITNFPVGQLGRHLSSYSLTVGTGEGQLLPGTYKYYDRNRGERVSVRSRCQLSLSGPETSRIDLTYGEPFEFTFHTYHGKVFFSCGGSKLVRRGD